MMKVATYLLAAIGLLFLGALANEVFFQSHTVDIEKRVEWASRIQNAPDVPVVLERGMDASVSMPLSWAHLTMRVALFSLPLMVIVIVGIGAFFAAKKMLAGRNFGQQADDQVVQELFEVSKKLDGRMEALETILLDRHRVNEKHTT